MIGFGWGCSDRDEKKWMYIWYFLEMKLVWFIEVFYVFYYYFIIVWCYLYLLVDIILNKSLRFERNLGF